MTEFRTVLALVGLVFAGVACSSFNEEEFILESMAEITAAQLAMGKPCPQANGPPDMQTFSPGQAGELTSGGHRFIIPTGAIHSEVTLLMHAPAGGVRGATIRPVGGSSTYQFGTPAPTIQLVASGCAGPAVIRQIHGGGTQNLSTTTNGEMASAGVRNLSFFMLAQP